MQLGVPLVTFRYDTVYGDSVIQHGACGAERVARAIFFRFTHFQTKGSYVSSLPPPLQRLNRSRDLRAEQLPRATTAQVTVIATWAGREWVVELNQSSHISQLLPIPSLTFLSPRSTKARKPQSTFVSLINRRSRQCPQEYGCAIIDYSGGCGGKVVRLLASHLNEPGSISCGVVPGFSHARGWAGFLQDIPFPSPFHSGVALYSSNFTLIGSEDLHVKSCPNLFTHSLIHYSAKLFVFVVRMEQLRNERAGESGDPRENTPTSGIVWHESHMQKFCGATPPRIEPGLHGEEASGLTTTPPRPPKFLVCWLMFASLHARLPTKSNRVQSSAGSPDFCKWESCRTMPLTGGFSRVSPRFPPPPSFQRHSILISITLIGSRNHDRFYGVLRRHIAESGGAVVELWTRIRENLGSNTSLDILILAYHVSRWCIAGWPASRRHGAGYGKRWRRAEVSLATAQRLSSTCRIAVMLAGRGASWAVETVPDAPKSFRLIEQHSAAENLTLFYRYSIVDWLEESGSERVKKTAALRRLCSCASKAKKRGSDTGDTNTHAYRLIAPRRKARFT
ncbi:hypothetical protein PR048_032638, partial [Dryococelus australis]